MPGKLTSWPDWPEYSQDTGETGSDLLGYKQAIIKEFGEEALTKSWLRTCAELESITTETANAGTNAIPEVDFDELFTLSPERKSALKEVGCFKVKGVIPQKQASAWFNDLKGYIAKNRSSIKGWPKETPFILNLYFSPTQMAARSHPNTLRLSRELNSWWHNSGDKATDEPLSYADGVRIRPPGVPFYGLGPHIDAGSLARWADPTYKAWYEAVWSGHPEDLDCYDLSKRKDADQAAFPGTAHSTVFRAFQGWTALSPAAPGEGSLMLYPNVKWAVSYLLLRPFFRAPEAKDEILDASKWTFDSESGWFPGTWKHDSQMLSPSSHPHLRMKECMVSIPAMQPGDTIWWHADVCHAVEVEHNGEHEASVSLKCLGNL